MATAIKKEPISGPAGTDELPEGWSHAPLGEVVDVLDSERVPVNHKEREGRKGEIPYYGATGQVGWIDDYLFDEELLLLGEDGAPFLDKSKPIAYLIGGKSWVNNHAHVLRAIKGLTSNQYLKHYLNRFEFTEYVTGTTRLKLTQAAMRSIPIIIAPYAEQTRIVAKIDELLEHVNAAREHLAKVPKILKAFRQSVLAAACSGRLTEDWREAQHLDIRHWAEATLADVAEMRLGKMLDHAKNIGAPTQYLRNVNVRWFAFDLNDLFFMRATNEERKELDIRNGDLLVCEGGEPGRCAVWNLGPTDLIFQKAIHRIRLKRNILPDWLAFNIKNDADSGALEQYFTGSGIKHLTGRSLATYTIQIPTIAEQQEIVRRVKILFKLADTIEKRVEAAAKRADRLTQSILAKAFRGELVPTEAELARREGRDYEPASVLLERIKAQRKIAAGSRKGRRRRS